MVTTPFGSLSEVLVQASTSNKDASTDPDANPAANLEVKVSLELSVLAVLV